MFVETYLTPTIGDFLQKYFINFDKPSFNLSWSGAGTLNDLIFKTDSLDKCLPIKVIAGKVGTLAIAANVGLVPGYSSTPKIAVTLKDVYILAAPPTEFFYDKAEAEAQALQSKRDELLSLERKRNESPKDNSANGADYGFLEQLLASALNNITVTLENIHIRFEDNRATPFSVGLTLKSVSLESVNSNWVPAETQSGARTTFKLLRMDALGLYLNGVEPSPIALNLEDRSPQNFNRILTALKDLLVNPAGRLTYALQPLDTIVKGVITLRPENLDTPFSLPRTDLEVQIPQLEFGITNAQFGVALKIGDILESMQRAKPYLAYRPRRIPYKGFGKIWWRFAFQGVLSDVRRRRQNWNWNHIKTHRELYRQYSKAYLNLIGQDSPSEQEKASVLELEDKLDNFNIILIRKQQDILNTRRKQKVAEKSKSLWWGTAKLTKQDLDEILNGKFSDEERAKLYETMQYEPAQESITYPDDFVGLKVKFDLPNVKIGITNIRDEGAEKCLDFYMGGTSLQFEQFPGSEGVRLDFSVEDIEVNGIEQVCTPANPDIPMISVGPESTEPPPAILMPFNDLVEGQKLVSLQLEKHKYKSGRATKRIKFNTEQLSFIYDAKSMQAVVDCFTWPSDVELSKTAASVRSVLSSGAKMSQESVLKLAEVTEEVELDINIAAPYMLFPEGGALSGKNSKVIINLGSLTVQGRPKQGAGIDPGTLEAIKSKDTEISPDILEKSYNHYQCLLKNFEILLALPNRLMFSDPSADASLQPLSLMRSNICQLDLNQCIITDDTRFPAVKVDFSFPLVEYDISDFSIVKLVSILAEFPFARMTSYGARLVDLTEDADANYTTEVEQLVSATAQRRSFTSRIAASEEAVNQLIRQSSQETTFDPDLATQFTSLAVTLSVNDVKIKLNRMTDMKHYVSKPLLNFALKDFLMTYKVRTFGNNFTWSMGEVSAIYLQRQLLNPDQDLYMFKTNAEATGNGDVLWGMKVFMASAQCPCNSTVGIVKNKAHGTISSVDMVLLEETLVTVLDVVNLIYKIIDENKSKVDKKEQIILSGKSKQEEATQGIANQSDDVDIELVANLNRFTIQVATTHKSILKICLDHLYAYIEDGPRQTKAILQINKVEILNLDTPTFYPTVVGLINQGERLLDAKICFYKGVPPEALSPDHEYDITLAPIKVVMLGSIIDNLLSFANKFQVAKAALIRLTKAAAKRAANVVKTAYASDDTKLSVSLKAHAPILYHPKETDSAEIILFRLGVVEIHNTLSAVETGSGRKAILDNIALTVTNMSCHSCLIDPHTEEILAELKITEPLSMKLDIKRNLSTAWYPELPLVKLYLECAPLVVYVSADDVILGFTNIFGIMRAFQNNQLPWVYTEEETADEGARGRKKSVTRDGTTAPYLCLIDYDSLCESYDVQLYTRSPKLTHKSGVVERGDEFRYAKLNVDIIQIRIKYWNNSDYKLQGSVLDATLEDSRPNINEVTKFLERRRTPGNEDEPIGNFELQRTELETTGQEYRFVLSVAFIEILVNMNFLSSILLMAKEIAESTPRLKKTVTPPKLEKILFAGGSSGSEDLPAPVLDCTVRIPGVSVIILEDTNSKDNTNAIMLRVDGNMDVKPTGNVSRGTGEFHLSLNTAKKNPGIPIIPLAQIVNPSTISVAINITPEEGVFVDMGFSHCVLRISSGTILIISKINTAISNLPRPGEGLLEELPENEEVWESVENVYRGYWFLRAKDLKDNVDNVVREEEIKDIATQYKNDRVTERLRISSVKVDVSFEVGSGAISTPLGLVNFDANYEAVNWTRNLLITGDTRLSASYNNTYYGVWEYLLEPVGIRKPFGEETSRWWELHGTISKPEGTPNVKFSASTTDIAEITVSKTAVALLMKLINSYSVAAFEDVSENEVKSPPYIFKNDTGFDLFLDIGNTPFVAFLEDGSTSENITLHSGEEVDLGLKPEVGASREGKAQLQRTVKVNIPQLQFSACIIISNAKPRYFELNVASYNGQKYGLLFDIVTSSGSSTYVTARSIVEVTNQLRVPVQVFNASRSGMQHITTIQPLSRWALPFSVVYEKSDGVCFKADGYTMGPVPFNYQSLRDTKDCVWSTTAAPESGQGDNANIKIIGKTLPSVVANTDTPSQIGQNFKIFLKGHLLINNLLPTSLTFESDGRTTHQVEAGKSVNLFCVTPHGKDAYSFNLRMSGYRGLNWFCRVNVESNDEVLVPLVFISEDNRHNVCMGYQKGYENDLVTLTVYCPYWMVNYTGLDLHYKSEYVPDITDHPADSDGLLMFAYNKTLGKDKLVLQVEDSEWSIPINIDAAGLPAGIICKGREHDYELNVEITLSKCQLSKIITITPRNKIVNTSPYDLIFNESDRPDDEILIQKHSTVSFWPKGTEHKFNVKVKGTDESSVNVFYDRDNNSFVKLENRYGGLHAVVHTSESKSTVTLSEFMPGEVPLLIVNDAVDIKLNYNQEGTEEEPEFLESGESVFYTWCDLTTTDRILVWGPAGYKETTRYKLDINSEADESGEFTSNVTKNKYRWAIVRSGVQKILLVTTNEDLIDSLKKMSSTAGEVPLLEINVQAKGVGVSLINNDIGQDILYVRVDSTEPQWEAGPEGQKHFKLLDHEQTMICEHGYQNYIAGKLKENPANLYGGITVDFADFKMIAPYAQKLQRLEFQPGVDFKFHRYSNSADIDLRLRTIQVDNQLPSAVHPRVFVVAPLAKSVTTESEIRPAIMILKLSKRTTPASNVNFISGTFILQEFNVATDMSLVCALVNIDPRLEQDESEKLSVQYKADLSSASRTLEAYNAVQVQESTAGRTIYVFENLDMFKLSFNLTFALSGGDGRTRNPFLFLTQGIGAAFGNITDKHFSVAGLAIKNMRLTMPQLLDKIVSAYFYGIIRNLYTIVFELDVLGNPFKLITGLGSGVGALLTEPFEGALHGNLLEGVGIGVGTLVDSTLGNVADSFSKITGSFAKGADAIGLHILGGAVGGISGLFGGVKKITHGTEKMALAIRPPRTFKSNSYLQPYSMVQAEGNSILIGVHASYPDTGELIHHIFVDHDKLILFAEKMALYVTVYPDELSRLYSVLWAHKWDEFASINQTSATEIDFQQKDAGGWLIKRNPHLTVPVADPATHAWVHRKSQEFLHRGQ